MHDDHFDFLGSDGHLWHRRDADDSFELHCLDAMLQDAGLGDLSDVGLPAVPCTSNHEDCMRAGADLSAGVQPADTNEQGQHQHLHHSDHVHSTNCGHDLIFHAGHFDYLVDGVLHSTHDGHCDIHGVVKQIPNIDDPVEGDVPAPAPAALSNPARPPTDRVSSLAHP